MGRGRNRSSRTSSFLLNSTAESGGANTEQRTNPFARYPVNTTLRGSIYFYVKRFRAASYNPQVRVAYGVRRGPLYLHSDIQAFGSAGVFATEPSCVLLGDGQGFVQDIEIRIVHDPEEGGKESGVFTVKLAGRELYLAESSADGRIYVSRTASPADCAARFTVDHVDAAGRVKLCTLGGRRMFDHGSLGWSTARTPPTPADGRAGEKSKKTKKGDGIQEGKELWMVFVSNEEKEERRRRNRWGIWQAEQQFVWR